MTVDAQLHSKESLVKELVANTDCSLSDEKDFVDLVVLLLNELAGVELSWFKQLDKLDNKTSSLIVQNLVVNVGYLHLSIYFST
jgi:hypothetical protein